MHTHRQLSSNALPGKRLYLLVLAICLVGGCRSPGDYRQAADRAAYDIVERAQERTLAQTSPFTIETPAQTLRRQLLLDQDLPQSGPASLGTGDLPPLPHAPPTDAPTVLTNEMPTVELSELTLTQALQIAAANNRDYQSRKEDVFRSALALDLEANKFRNLLAGDVQSDYREDHRGENTVRGLANTGSLSWQRRLKYGTLLTTKIAVDLVKLLTMDRSSSFGLLADATITMPLLRGAGRHIVTEPLTQAEQDVVYALHNFERFRKTLAVRVATDYMAVLQQFDQVRNAEDNYQRLAVSTDRVRRLAEAGRLPRIQMDQALQDDLRALDRLTSAKQTYAGRLDNFKITLGLPTDAQLELDRSELDRLTADGPRDKVEDTDDQMERETRASIIKALANRLDLRTAQGRVFDAQRKTLVAADALRMGLTLSAGGAVGESRGLSSADQPDARLRFDEGLYTAGLGLDLPLERTAERNAWRNSLITLERATRDLQALEDQIKLDIRDALRARRQALASHRIQQQALAVAERRVASTELFLQAGRAQVRDILEAQEALVSARNSLTAALVNYRTAELQLLRDMGVLTMNQDGSWMEDELEINNE
ncbi:MAG: TolC family protein [Kiritimatiellia bacterium]